MASVVNNILTLKNTIVKITNTRTGTPTFTEFSDATNSAVLNMAYDIIEHKPVSGVNQTQVGTITWSATLEISQDLKTGSFWLYCLNNHGAAGKIEFYPKGGTLPKVTGDIIIGAPSQVGGSAGSALYATVTFSFDGAATVTPEA
ncbi:hypothetical protein ACFUOZ_04665 [Paenarthrobacter sp. NPDC057355]|uniref:hypothetical protein n=1 Tax=Paenarthrobacter sp. NPDC057355 TaxID=3346105 RepID=UPI003633D471